MPLTADEKLQAEAQIERGTAAAALRKKGCSYLNEHETFIRWVVEHDPPTEGDNPPRAFNNYIDRTSADAYFHNAVVLRTCSKASVTRIYQSIQWFYDNHEDRGGGFMVCNPQIQAAVNQQQENRLNMPTSKLGTDPHKGLKDLLSENDKVKIVNNIWRDRTIDWGSLLTSFLWGNQAGVQGASSRIFLLSDLFTSRGFGPARDGPRSMTLLLMLRGGGPQSVHKDKFTSDRMVGCWRHRVPSLRAVGSLAFHLINTLRQDGDIDFYHADKTARASWWDKALIAYDTLNEESNAMKDVRKATGVEGCKITHNRTYAVQMAGSEGLAPHKINSFTKHMLKKFHKSYQAEVDKEACKVMAGISKDQGYFVERDFLNLPADITEIINRLLPRCSDWAKQHNSVNGDKSSCCHHFLFDIIPHLVRVAFQDGAYLIKDFPNHEMSNYLKVCMLGVLFVFGPFFKVTDKF
jgi:hypothetical protein